jgi:hypothetical protein
MNPMPKERRQTMNNPKLSEAALRRFTGSEHWYRHGLVRQVLYTDGAKYIADEGGAYWLLDEIALAQRYEKAVGAQEFQVWTLKVGTVRNFVRRLGMIGAKELVHAATQRTSYP